MHSNVSVSSRVIRASQSFSWSLFFRRSFRFVFQCPSCYQVRTLLHSDVFPLFKGTTKWCPDRAMTHNQCASCLSIAVNEITCSQKQVLKKQLISIRCFLFKYLLNNKFKNVQNVVIHCVLFIGRYIICSSFSEYVSSNLKSLTFCSMKIYFLGSNCDLKQKHCDCDPKRSGKIFSHFEFSTEFSF